MWGTACSMQSKCACPTRCACPRVATKLTPQGSRMLMLVQDIARYPSMTRLWDLLETMVVNSRLRPRVIASILSARVMPSRTQYSSISGMSLLGYAVMGIIDNSVGRTQWLVDNGVCVNHVIATTEPVAGVHCAWFALHFDRGQAISVLQAKAQLLCAAGMVTCPSSLCSPCVLHGPPCRVQCPGIDFCFSQWKRWHSCSRGAKRRWVIMACVD